MSEADARDVVTYMRTHTHSSSQDVPRTAFPWTTAGARCQVHKLTPPRCHRMEHRLTARTAPCSEIVEDEFLAEVTKSKQVVLHFYHDEFERCKVFDKVRLQLSVALEPLSLAACAIGVLTLCVGAVSPLSLIRCSSAAPASDRTEVRPHQVYPPERREGAILR